MKDLLVAVPSRGRPYNIARLQEAMQSTCRGDTTLLVGLDDDDPDSESYPAGPEYEVQAGLHQVVAWINKLTVPRASQYRFIGTIGDDNVPRTEGWDTRIMEALAENPFAYGNDRYPHRPPGTLACHVFCRSGIITALGYLGPPVLRHMYVDDAWTCWGQACGISYLDDVIIEHLHYTTGAAPLDETYARASVMMGSDLHSFEMYCRNQLAADIATIKGVL